MPFLHTGDDHDLDISPSILGRVLSFYTTLTVLVVPLELLLAGPAAERTGVAPWFAISGAAIAVAACAVELAPSARAAPRLTGRTAGRRRLRVVMKRRDAGPARGDRRVDPLQDRGSAVLAAASYGVERHIIGSAH